MRRPPGLRETESGSRQPRKQQREGSHAPHARPDRPGPQVSRPGTPFGRVFGPGGSRRFAFAHTPPSTRLDRNPHKGCATRPEPRGFRILQAASGPCAHRWRPRPQGPPPPLPALRVRRSTPIVFSPLQGERTSSPHQTCFARKYRHDRIWPRSSAIFATNPNPLLRVFSRRPLYDTRYNAVRERHAKNAVFLA